jgi:hypothetical protein
MNKLNKVPWASELGINGFPFDSSIINRKFNKTYNEFVISLGLEPTGWVGKIKTEEELLEDFMNLFKKLQRIPNVIDINSDSDMVCYSAYKHRLGNIKDICDLLDINYEDYYKGDTLGRVCCDKYGNVCKSINEKIISDFFIDNDIKFEKEVSYKKLLKNDVSKRRFDWEIVIKNKHYYVEYFGMYIRNKKSKLSRNYAKKFKKKINDLYKNNKINQCIFIFNYDVEKGLLKEKFENLFDIKLEYKNKETLTPYYKMTDNELFDKVMQYSIDGKEIPTYTYLVKHQQSHLTKEINKRYKYYSEFIEKCGVRPEMRHRDYWTIDKIYEMFLCMIDKYGSIINPKKIVKLNDKKLKGLDGAIGNINIPYNQLKLDFFKKFYKNIQMPEIEILWLNNVVNNKGTGIKNHVTKEQQEQAKDVLINSNSYEIYEKIQKDKYNTFVNTVFIIFDNMIKDYGDILGYDDYYKYSKINKSIYYPNMIEKVKKYGSLVDMHILYIRHLLDNNNILPESQIVFLKNVAIKNTYIIGKYVSDNNIKNATQILNQISTPIIQLHNISILC